uniref:Tyrosine hydroxylase n=1 Tax=Dugesia japonica TaxID=6161 RepID=A6P4D3_DUGJA|nr:tyrosine hydroxylase [Dugesia japonica]
MSYKSRRLQFQKTFSYESEFLHRSIIEDAKYDAALNSEFSNHFKNKDFSEDEEKYNHTIKMLFHQDYRLLEMVINNLKIADIELIHIESRLFNSKDYSDATINGLIPNSLEILFVFNCTKKAYKDIIENLSKEDKEYQKLTDLKIKDEIAEDIWIPKHISDLDSCNHLMLKFQPEMASDHPGFHDKIYKSRRMEIAEIAFNFKYGDKIPRVEYFESEKETWREAYITLTSLYKDYACKEQLIGIKKLEEKCGYGPNDIPQLEDISNYLKKTSGFQLRPVAGLLSARDFLASLAFRVFQCTQYTRHHSKPLHTPEPDCIHELLGHVPMLSDAEFAEFSQEIGLCSLGASDSDIERLATLYWFTIEFGLCYENKKIKAFGAGLLSSFGELKHAISNIPEHRNFDPQVASVTPYKDEDYQPVYYVIDSVTDMKEKVRQFAKSIKRQNPIRYDPYTETIEILNNKKSVCHLGRVIKHELDTMENSLSSMLTF